ncbi:MAG: PQQ-binding-like beta-propeller repeat protein [Myxococcales bacterium]|nr:PQQ-like beta-propeller repeat protein [Myxococcales bacterium]
MIRIKPGRSWRMNPAYVGELRALKSPRGFTGAEILDVLGVEVDGVDIAAGVGEARVLVAIDELSQALLRMGDGEPAAQATIGPGPTELVLEARGPDLLLTLVSLAPPARVLSSGLLVDARKMRSATLHAARGLLLDLLAISPVLSAAPLAQRLGQSCSRLARPPTKVARRWPAREAAARAMVFHPADARRRSESLQLQLPPETAARLHGRGDVRFAPLAPHLGNGSLALVRRGAPGLVCEGPPYLILRNLLGEAERLVEAWETGARSIAVHFGPHELSCDLTNDEIRAPGWRQPAALPALRVARLVALAALGYADEADEEDELAQDLRERAHQLERHCHDLETGDLRRAPETVAAPAAPQELQRQGPLTQGRMRRLVYREAWRAPAPGAVRALPFGHGPVLAELPGALHARDAETGDPLWTVPAAPGAVARGLELFYAEPGDALVRLDVATGEVRWKRRLRGAAHPARLWALPGGVARSLPGEGLAVAADEGTLAFRTKLPGGAPTSLLAVDRVLVAALGSGSLAGLDPADGRILWKRRCSVVEMLANGSRALVLSEGALMCVDPHSGEQVWEREVPAGSRSLTIAHGNALLLGGEAALAFSAGDGAPRPSTPLPWARDLAAGDDPEAVIATGDGHAARLDGKRWSIALEDAGAAQIQRGIALVGPRLFDVQEGLLVAQVPPSRAATLAPDLSVALLIDDEIAVWRLATHLSLL